jgi:ferredoxin
VVLRSGAMESAGQRIVIVDKALCASFGRCVEREPGAFGFDDDEQSVANEEAARLPDDRLHAVTEACPVSAIAVTPSLP